MEDQNLTMKQAASYCGMNYEAFRVWVKRDLVPGITMFDTRRQFSLNALKGWIPPRKARGGYKGRKS